MGLTGRVLWEEEALDWAKTETGKIEINLKGMMGKLPVYSGTSLDYYSLRQEPATVAMYTPHPLCMFVSVHSRVLYEFDDVPF